MAARPESASANAACQRDLFVIWNLCVKKVLAWIVLAEKAENMSIMTVP
jgi:hypothetical protein